MTALHGLSDTPFEAVTSPVEVHPLQPFLPEGCRLLMLGSFPPPEHRWSMRFYYPNFANDMWRIVGLCFFGDKTHFVDESRRTFRLSDITDFLAMAHIGLSDTARIVHRAKDTASDKYLEIVKAADIASLMRKTGSCEAVVATGQKALDTLCAALGMEQQPKMGNFVETMFEDRTIRVYRMPSSSRAYPMPLGRKAEFYKPMFSRETDAPIWQDEAKG